MLTFIAMLANDLHALVESNPSFEWARWGQHLPCEWIEHAVQASGSASIRRRRLPAQQVVVADDCAGVVPAPVDQRSRR
jgi:hypothetical protein